MRLGQYATDAEVSEGEQGFPVYLDGQFFMSLAHPSGWATAENGSVTLKQYPGRTLAAGGQFQCMETVLGVAEPHRARTAFLSYIRSHMRRTRRNHDVAYTIFEPFGASSEEIIEENEQFLLDNLAKVNRSQITSGCHFDFYAIEFWVDHQGDLMRPEPRDFPTGFEQVDRVLSSMGTLRGLWIDSSWAAWSIGKNPVTACDLTYDPAYGTEDLQTLCRATDPIKTMYTTAFRHHIREQGVRLLKFDNLHAICYNPHHGHLPGIYSTEAIQSAIIEFLQELDAECADVFLMLYWGHRSPWWLIAADTLFESGLYLEASHPAASPTLYIRDSVILGLDQAQWWCQDVPTLGKDSLGVWLSNWKWNSSIGKERWQEAMVMDMCRGSLLLQPWSDTDWLTPEEHSQMANFIALLRQRSDCFANPRFVVGNPWNAEPYGYCCSNGERAFVALYNCTWSDAVLLVTLTPEWGLPSARAWNVFRWYPDPAKLQGVFHDKVSISLRPFEIVLLELVGDNEAPSLHRTFEMKPMPHSFAESTTPIALCITSADIDNALRVPREEDTSTEKHTPLPPKRVVMVTGQLPSNQQGGTLVVTCELFEKADLALLDDCGKFFAVQAMVAGNSTASTPVVRNRTYPASWQAWRIKTTPSVVVQEFELRITMMIPESVSIQCHGFFIPDSDALRPTDWS